MLPQWIIEKKRDGHALFDDAIMLLQIGDFALNPTAVSISNQEWEDIVELAAGKIGDS